MIINIYNIKILTFINILLIIIFIKLTLLSSKGNLAQRYVN